MRRLLLLFLIMCLTPLPVPVRISSRRYYRPRARSALYRNLSSLSYPTRSTHVQHLVTGGLWNCQSATRKADFISGFAIQQSLDFLALTETWITPENTSTPAALSSAFSFSHTPRPTGSLGHFLEELDILLSNFPENGPPLILLGDFNIQTEKSSDLLHLLSSFALSLSPSPPTHKAGNHLDYIFTRNCSTTNLSVTPLHVSDHFFISYSLPHSITNKPPSLTNSIPARRNIRSLSPSSLASSVLSALPSTDSFSLLHPNAAAETLLSTLSSSLDSLCPLTTRRTGKSPPAPWLSQPVRAMRATMRASERKWRKYKRPEDLLEFQSLLSSFSASISAA
ncbi:uncharacterized protein LOC144392631 [Gasterosteus aculeatus]